MFEKGGSPGRKASLERMSAESKDKVGFIGRLFRMRHADEAFWEQKPDAVEEVKPALPAQPRQPETSSPKPAPVAPEPPLEPLPPALAPAPELTPETPAQQTPALPPTPIPEAPPPPSGPSAKPSWWARLRQGLSRSSSSITQGVADIFTKKKLSADMLEDL